MLNWGLKMKWQLKWQKAIVLMGISLIVTSCGVKKEPSKVETPPATQTPAPAEQPAPTPQLPPSAPPSTAKETKPLPKNEVKDKQGRDSLDLSNRTSKKMTKKLSAEQKESEKLKARTSAPKYSFNSKDPSSNDNLFVASNSSKITTSSAILTGGGNDLGFIYSGASNDSILKFLISEENKVTAQQAQLNKILAGSIMEMSYLVDKTKQITIDITLRTGNEISDIRLQTAFKENSLMKMSEANLFVTAQCVDSYKYSDDCSNLVVKIKNEGAQSHAILRHSNANIKYWHYNVEDAEYNELFQYLKNSSTDRDNKRGNEAQEEMKHNRHNRIEEVYFNSFEIVNGRAGFTAIIKGQDNQIISLKSELMLKRDLTAAQNNVEKNLDESDLNVHRSTQGSRGNTSFMDLFKSATVIENNSMGHVTVEIKTESKKFKISNKILLIFSRISIPTSFPSSLE